MKEKEVLRLLVISSCSDAWGGSEELWSGAALELLGQGHQVRVLKTTVDNQHGTVKRLQAAGCPVIDLEATPSWGTRLTNRLLPTSRQTTLRAYGCQVIRQALTRFQPSLVVVSQGCNFDGVEFAAECLAQNVPYVLVCQKAIDFFFPPAHQRHQAQEVYRGALRCYFVSEHNRQLTQWQLGFELPQAQVIRNPFQVPFQGELPFPGGEVLRLACVARLNLLDKGQDILLRVLAQPHWQERPVHVTLFGSGPDRLAIEEMAAMLGVRNLTLGGQVADISQVWATHHALVLPSRSEGLPLALVEAMLCGRPAIITAAGGNAELVLDNETGFLAAAATPEALDEALERAWDHREHWGAMGQRAAAYARQQTVPHPARYFADCLLRERVLV
ncbi:glycosyltransferase family 4 protein [Hymenobacter sp. BT18]|uniref:glycosyltransferase family 4 protein n=1 Tax=Hymenobacter TaxID=89966 RepID=UPI00143E5B77|nr:MULTISPECIES: glycosyltransferase family 4 protein [Hymenobacter]QIX60262.1 glycosyltransferase family 4 protein [Hymenobacter sp. BT18]